MFGQGALGQLALGQPEDEFPPVACPVTGFAEFSIEPAAVVDIQLDEQVVVNVEVS
jgi:hypothetical protein